MPLGYLAVGADQAGCFLHRGHGQDGTFASLVQLHERIDRAQVRDREEEDSDEDGLSEHAAILRPSGFKHGRPREDFGRSG